MDRAMAEVPIPSNRNQMRTDYKVYRTTKGAYRYKLGLALVKLPNQPFCQIRDFQVQQDKVGAGHAAARLHRPLGYTGIFVKCP